MDSNSIQALNFVRDIDKKDEEDSDNEGSYLDGAFRRCEILLDAGCKDGNIWGDMFTTSILQECADHGILDEEQIKYLFGEEVLVMLNNLSCPTEGTAGANKKRVVSHNHQLSPHEHISLLVHVIFKLENCPEDESWSSSHSRGVDFYFAWAKMLSYTTKVSSSTNSNVDEHRIILQLCEKIDIFYSSRFEGDRRRPNSESLSCYYAIESHTM